MSQEISYLLPTGWTVAPINDLIGKDGLFVDGDWIESKDQNRNGTVKLIQLADIGDGEFKDKSNRFMTYEKAVELNCTFLEYGDILVARMPEPLGRAVLFPFDEKMKYVSVVDVAIIRTGEGIFNKYLMYFINAPEIRRQINRLQTGTTRKRISRNNLSQIAIPVPPLKEQYRIVEKIEELFSELDQVMTTLLKIQKQLEVYRKSLLSSAFKGGLTSRWREANPSDTALNLLRDIEAERENKFKTELASWKVAIQDWLIAGKKGKQPQKPKKHRYNILSESEIVELPAIPSSWIWMKISVFEELVSSGATPKGGRNVYIDKGVPFIRSQNIYPNLLKLEDVVYIERTTHDHMDRTKLKGRDILLNITGASIGRCAFLPEYFGEGNVSQHVCIIRTFTDKVNYQLISWYLNSPIAQKIINHINSGATREALTMEQIRSFPFPLAPEGEQEEILQLIDLKTSIADNLKKIITDTLLQAKILRETILKVAFQGNLVNQEPSDLSASDLLKHIKEARSAFLANKKTEKKIKVKRAIMGKPEKSIIQVLEESGQPLSAKEVWERSRHNHDIEAFYNELKHIQDKVSELEKGILTLNK